MEVFRASDAPPASRAAYWSDVYSRAFAPVAVNPSRSDQFQAELQVGALGPMEFACMRSRAASAERKAKRHEERMIGFVILVRGAGAASHCGLETRLGSGDILMTDSTETMLTRFDTPLEAITVRVSETLLRSRLPSFDSFRGRRLPGCVGLADTSVAMAKNLSSKLDDALSWACATRASGHLLDVLATSYGAAFAAPVEEASLAAARRAQISAFINGNLTDPDLRPALVAQGLGISPRYLRKVLAEKGETASSFILRRRLEECARELASDGSRARSITDIAFSWGFNSTAHFARVFRAKYGESPRSFRLRSREEHRRLPHGQLPLIAAGGRLPGGSASTYPAL